MTPSFHFKALDRAADDFGKHTQTLFELIDSYEGKSPVNIYTYLKPYMLDMLSGKFCPLTIHCVVCMKSVYILKNYNNFS